MDRGEAMLGGTEWFVDAQGCDLRALSCLATVRSVCELIIADLGLCVVGEPQWHQFPDPAGVTGLYLLSESHLACHTFPECGLASFNLYCCRPKAVWSWEAQLKRRFRAVKIQVRRIERFARAPIPSDIASG